MITKLVRYFLNKDYRFRVNESHGLSRYLSDEKYLKRKFKATFGYELNLDNPQTYNEKLQWLKLHDRKPAYTKMVDKYSAKKYVADIIGEQYLIPTLGVWNSFDEIDFDSLPNQFVLKCTHDSGGVLICRDKSQFDRKKAKQKLDSCLKANYYYKFREWPYKHVKPRIIAEKYMEDSLLISNSSADPKTDDSTIPASLKDYKVYTFNGKAKILMIAQDRTANTKADYFDRDFNWLDFTWGYKHASEKPEKPHNLDLMYELAEKLAAGTIELRVDFYEVNGQVFFGELTFFDGSGFDRIEPIEWDYKLGSMFDLPTEY